MLIGHCCYCYRHVPDGRRRLAKDPNVFHKDEVYSTTRITIAPILILAGLVIEIYAIFRKPKG